MKKTKVFSSANLAMFLSGFTLLITYFFKTRNTLSFLPQLTIPLFILSIFLFSALFLLKFPLFIVQKEEQIKENYYDQKYEENISFFKRLYFSLLSSEPSQIISFFSRVTLKLFNKNELCKFSWENGPVKVTHRILDLLLTIPLVAISFLLGYGLSKGNFYFSLVLCLIFFVFMFKNRIITYSLSIEVENTDSYKLKVIYPYKKNKISFIKHYGMSFPFAKTILISDEIFSSNSTSLKEYVIAHEVGHLKDKKRLAFTYSLAVFFTIYLVMGPYFISSFGFKYFAFLPILTFLLYWVLFGFDLNEKAELLADEYAIKTIGKENCLTALEILKNDSKENGSNYYKFLKPIPISRRIQFINEYQEKEN